MRSLFAIFLTLTVFLSLVGCSSDDTPIGFQGHQWGTPVDDLRSEFGLKFIDQDENLNTSTFRTNLKEWKGIPLATCNFSFFEDKLYAVSMVAEGQERGEELRDKLSAQYGQGHSRGRASHSWETLGTMINYYYHDAEQTAFVDMMSTLYSASVQKKILDMALNTNGLENF